MSPSVSISMRPYNLVRAKVSILNNSIEKRITIFGSLVVFVSSLTLLTGCFSEDFTPSQSSDISFSIDTLRFDTVFTEIGSITRPVRIRNLSDNNITIQEIKLTEPNSKFRMNVDGLPGSSFENVRINALDSVWVFIEVTIDPDEPLSTSPFVINETVEVSSGADVNLLHLEAFGQNANYFPSRDAQGQVVGLTCNNSSIVWDDPRPYVVNGLLFIDSCGLVISPGTQVFVHGGVVRLNGQIVNDGGLFFLPNGSIDVLGTADQPVVIQGDRLESAFDDVPGQWSGIRLLAGSRNNRFSHATIRNSIVGIRADSASQVLIESCDIHNTSNVGFIGIGAEAVINNSLFYNNAAQSILLSQGGNYELNYNTIANNINDQPGLFIDNFQCLDIDCEQIATRPNTTTIRNSIITGSNPNEIVIVDITDGSEPESLNLSFSQTILRVDETENLFDFSAVCDGCLINPEGPIFFDASNDIYTLDTMSAGLNLGVPIPNIATDQLGVLRNVTTPDLGCFELVE